MIGEFYSERYECFVLSVRRALSYLSIDNIQT